MQIIKSKDRAQAGTWVPAHALYLTRIRYPKSIWLVTEVSGKTFDTPLLKRVLNYVKPYLNIFCGTAIFAILIAFLSPARPLLIQYAFDNYIFAPNEDKTTYYNPFISRIIIFRKYITILLHLLVQFF